MNNGTQVTQIVLIASPHQPLEDEVESVAEAVVENLDHLGINPGLG